MSLRNSGYRFDSYRACQILPIVQRIVHGSSKPAIRVRFPVGTLVINNNKFMRYKIDNIEIDVYYNDVIIWNSNTIKFKDIKPFIMRLMYLDSTCNILKQRVSFLCAELYVHNILYKLGICKIKTEHTNLSLIEDMKWYERLVYNIFSILF